MMFILSSSGLELWSGKHTSIYENFKFKAFKDIKFFGEIINNWRDDLLGTNVCMTLESCW